MPALNTVVINDGASTPVARNFIPGAKDASGLQRWYDKTALSAIGFWQLAQGLRYPSVGGKVSNSNRIYLATVKLQLPILEVTSASTGTGIQPAPTVAYQPEVEVTFRLPERSSVQDRKHLRVLLLNYLQHANLVALIDNLEPVYNG